MELLLNKEEKTEKKTLVSLFKCGTKGGERMLRANILQPFCSIPHIEERQLAVSFFLENKKLLFSLSEKVRKLSSAETICSRFIQCPVKGNTRCVAYFNEALIEIKNAFPVIVDMGLECEEFDLPILKEFRQLLENSKLFEIKKSLDMNIEEQPKFSNNPTLSKYLNCIALKENPDSYYSILKSNFFSTVNEILSLIENYKSKASEFTLTSTFRKANGFFLSMKAKKSESEMREDLSAISLKLSEELIQISKDGSSIKFTTTTLFSLNNRLEENNEEIFHFTEE